MNGHCCFTGCDLVTCRNCGETRCVRAFHTCPPREEQPTPDHTAP